MVAQFSTGILAHFSISIYTSYERTTTVTLKAGQKESDHNNFWLGVSNGGSWGWNIYVNGIEKINGDTYVYNGITYNIVVL